MTSPSQPEPRCSSGCSSATTSAGPAGSVSGCSTSHRRGARRRRPRPRRRVRQRVRRDARVPHHLRRRHRHQLLQRRREPARQRHRGRLGELQPDTLGVAPTAVDFGITLTGVSEQTVKLSNLGFEAGDPTSRHRRHRGRRRVQHRLRGPGGARRRRSDSFDVTFSPTADGPQTGTLTIAHTGRTAPVVVTLAGDASNDIPVSFWRPDSPVNRRTTRHRCSSVPMGGCTSLSRTARSRRTRSSATAPPTTGHRHRDHQPGQERTRRTITTTARRTADPPAVR